MASQSLNNEGQCGWIETVSLLLSAHVSLRGEEVSVDEKAVYVFLVEMVQYSEYIKYN